MGLISPMGPMGPINRPALADHRFPVTAHRNPFLIGVFDLTSKIKNQTSKILFTDLSLLRFPEDPFQKLPRGVADSGGCQGERSFVALRLPDFHACREKGGRLLVQPLA